jgi:hypothetical protein
MCSETGSKKATLAEKPCPKCSKKYTRRQDVERHFRETHLPHHNYCDQPGCDWTGNRHNAHLADKHKGVLMPEGEYMIYDAKGLAKRVLNKEINIEQAVDEARSLYQTKAAELGKLGIWKALHRPEYDH